ncbi:MAG: YdcF family protein [Byssovorax sp.]
MHRERAGELLRLIGLALGVFAAMNLIGELVRPPFEVLSDWVELPGPPLARGLYAAGTVAILVLHGLAPIRAPGLRRLGALLLAGLAASASVDTFLFYRLLASGRIHTPAVVPSSLLLVALFAALAVQIARAPGPRPPLDRSFVLKAIVTGALVAAALPLVQMFTFGPTRYDRPADCAVVFGARVWNDGRPSDALADRVDESVRLYQRGLVKKILMSGAVDPHNGHSEPVVMRDRAVERGVPAEAILLDEAGVDTASTVRNTATLLQREGLPRALVVSHYYHEPRVKMLFDRAGVRAYTVPATMQRRLLKEPYFILREIAAYYHSFLFE